VEKFLPVRDAKLKAMDKIMDKMWKTPKGFLRAAMNVCATNFAHSLQQAFLSRNKLYRKLHNNCYCC
jgi:hypothetical protein